MTTQTLTGPRPIYAPLWPVYDRDGHLLGAFLTEALAVAYADHINHGPEVDA